MIYAIGDIHGHLDQLKAAHAMIAEDRVRAGGAPGRIVHVGDLVDRGPDAKGVIQFLIDGIASGEDWIVLCGNHDRCFAEFLSGELDSPTGMMSVWSWLGSGMGGRATLASYGLWHDVPKDSASLLARARFHVPDAHREFLEALPLWHREDGMIFVHAGIRPGVPMDRQEDYDLVWIREEFHRHRGDHEALVVHGHTPVDAPTHYGNRVNIDAGAGMGRPIVPVVFDRGDCHLLGAHGRKKLTVHEAFGSALDG